MAQIIRGTTPTIEFTFNEVAVGDIATAILTVKQGGAVVIEKDKSVASTGETSLSWSLTQEESLLLEPGTCHIMLNWVLADGTRGASNESGVSVVRNHIGEVIA